MPRISVRIVCIDLKPDITRLSSEASNLQTVRQMVVEQLGCIAKALWADKDASDADMVWLAAMSLQAGAPVWLYVLAPFLCTCLHRAV